jgi:hypothetical protein
MSSTLRCGESPKRYGPDMPTSEAVLPLGVLVLALALAAKR